jgi:ABC-type taurine transport system ATPase subunit
MPRVAFEDIIKTYGKLTVLKNLDLSIDDGEFLVLLGPSGCGKTTLLNLLAGLLDVTAGRITIGDRDVTDLDPKDRGLAMVFQSYALYPTKTVYGNLKFGLSAAKLDKAEVERRIAARGLQGRVSVLFQDYATIEGENLFDKISSIGMFEQVGLKNHETYFKTVHRLLKPRGLYLHHSIARPAKPGGLS